MGTFFNRCAGQGCVFFFLTELKVLFRNDFVLLAPLNLTLPHVVDGLVASHIG